jgi:hypothetical protein
MSHGPAAAGDPALAGAFDALMAEVMASADRFGHRQHISDRGWRLPASPMVAAPAAVRV